MSTRAFSYTMGKMIKKAIAVLESYGVEHLDAVEEFGCLADPDGEAQKIVSDPEYAQSYAEELIGMSALMAADKYRGILEQDGWEATRLTVEAEWGYAPAMVKAILAALESTETGP